MVVRKQCLFFFLNQSTWYSCQENTHYRKLYTVKWKKMSNHLKGRQPVSHNRDLLHHCYPIFWVLDRDHKKVNFNTFDTDSWPWWIINEEIQSVSRQKWIGSFTGGVKIILSCWFFSPDWIPVNLCLLSKYSYLAQGNQIGPRVYARLFVLLRRSSAG